jgi:ABC-type nitrate/sulfonate/bicarbonate transport system substrate-binding protein
MKAVFSAAKFMHEHPEDSAELVAKTIGWPREAVLAAHKISGPLFSLNGQVSVEALSSMQDILLEHGVIKKKLPVEEHIAREFFPVRL